MGVLDTGLTTEGGQFLVMQYIEGVTLRSIVDPGGLGFTRVAGLIRLGLARAYATAGDATRSRAAYEDLFALWRTLTPTFRCWSRLESNTSR